MANTRLTLSLSREAAEKLKQPETLDELNRALAREGLPAILRVEDASVRECYRCGSYYRRTRDRCPSCAQLSPLALARQRVEARRGR